MTEDEAKRRWCPFAASRVLVIPGPNPVVKAYSPEDSAQDIRSVSGNCVASFCMAWRWDILSSPDGALRRQQGQGRCGLAGEVRVQ
jgi:hypothetical protein